MSGDADVAALSVQTRAVAARHVQILSLRQERALGVRLAAVRRRQRRAVGEQRWAACFDIERSTADSGHLVWRLDAHGCVFAHVNVSLCNACEGEAWIGATAQHAVHSIAVGSNCAFYCSTDAKVVARPLLKAQIYTQQLLSNSRLLAEYDTASTL